MVETLYVDYIGIIKTPETKADKIKHLFKSILQKYKPAEKEYSPMTKEEQEAFMSLIKPNMSSESVMVFKVLKHRK